MSWFKKIKEFFFRKVTTLPSSDEFRGDRDDFDPDEIFESGKSDDKSPIAPDHSPKRKGSDAPPFAGDDFGDLFFDEDDDIDAEDLRSKSVSEVSKEEDRSPADDRSEESSEDIRDSLKKEAGRAGQKLRQSADKVNEKVDEFLDRTVKKSKKLDEIEAVEKKASSGFMKYREKSMLDDQGDFFSKAKAFAEGRPLTSEEEMDNSDDTDDPSKDSTSSDDSKSKNKDKIHRSDRGADDDIEDAIVVDDDDKE